MEDISRRKVGWGGMLVLLLPCLIWAVIDASRERLKIPVEAPPYAWSAECPEAEYKKDDSIPAGCARSEYEIQNYRDYPEIGFAPRHRPFYRVGNDIDEIVCGWSTCQVNRTLRNAFKQ
jgi:hypothetical protein